MEQQENKNRLFISAEIAPASQQAKQTELLSIAAVLYGADWQIKKRFYGILNLSLVMQAGQKSENLTDREKIIHNLRQYQLAQYAGFAEFKTEDQLITAFLCFWQENSSTAECISDMNSETEKVFLQKCRQQHSEIDSTVVQPAQLQQLLNCSFCRLSCQGAWLRLKDLLQKKSINTAYDQQQLLEKHGYISNNALSNAYLAADLVRLFDLLSANEENKNEQNKNETATTTSHSKPIQDPVYSYHTFFFPFIWEGELDSKMNFKKICKHFGSQNSMWRNIDMKHEYSMDSAANVTNIEDARLLYQEYQYFHQPVRKAIYGFDDKIVSAFDFLPDKVRNKATFLIEKAAEHFLLHINSIKLKIYNTGVALMIFECENRGLDQDNRPMQKNIKTVKLINEYGRRMAVPFLPGEDANDFFAMCADKLSINIDGLVDEKKGIRNVICTDYHDFFVKIKECYTTNNFNLLIEKVELTYISNIIKDLLSLNNEMNFISSKNKINKGFRKEDSIYIYPAIDDRMFVACLIRDSAYANLMKNGRKIWSDSVNSDDQTNSVTINDNKSGGSDSKNTTNKPKRSKNYKVSADKYGFETDPILGANLYELIFIDKPDGITCPTKREMYKLLNRQLYLRWFTCGTIHGITNQAFICVTSESTDIDKSVVIPFLIIYCQMIALVLAQRASIISFQRWASVLAKGIEKPGMHMKSFRIAELMDLQERYIAFQNQLSFFEVTPQEQGIELYDMLQECLYIGKDQELLQRQLNNLYESANINQGFAFNKWAIIISLSAILLALGGCLSDVVTFTGTLDNITAKTKLMWVTEAGLIVAIFIIVNVFYSRRHFFIKIIRKIRKWIAKVFSK